MIDWTEKQHDAAVEEGWCISEIGCDNRPPWELCRLDELEMFENDGDVWQHVVTLASLGSHLHLLALRFLKKHSKSEFDNIFLSWTLPEDTNYWFDRYEELKSELEKSERVEHAYDDTQVDRRDLKIWDGLV